MEPSWDRSSSMSSTLLLFSCCVQIFVISWTAARQASLSFTISQSLLKLMSIELVMPSNHLSLCHCLLLLPSIFSQHQGLFQRIGSLYQGGQNTRDSASVLPVNFQDWFPLVLSGSTSCCPRNSQESSPAPLFESIISWMLNLLYSPTLTFIHDYWKNHSFN